MEIEEEVAGADSDTAVATPPADPSPPPVHGSARKSALLTNAFPRTMARKRVRILEQQPIIAPVVLLGEVGEVLDTDGFVYLEEIDDGYLDDERRSYQAIRMASADNEGSPLTTKSSKMSSKRRVTSGGATSSSAVVESDEEEEENNDRSAVPRMPSRKELNKYLAELNRQKNSEGVDVSKSKAVIGSNNNNNNNNGTGRANFNENTVAPTIAPSPTSARRSAGEESTGKRNKRKYNPQANNRANNAEQKVQLMDGGAELHVGDLLNENLNVPKRSSGCGKKRSAGASGFSDSENVRKMPCNGRNVSSNHGNHGNHHGRQSTTTSGGGGANSTGQTKSSLLHKEVQHLNSVELGENTFRWLINPLTVPEFFDKFWEKKASLIKRKDDGYYQHLVSFKALNDALVNHCVEFTKNLDVTMYHDSKWKILFEPLSYFALYLYIISMFVCR